MSKENSWESFKKYWNATEPGNESTIQLESILQEHPYFLQAFSLGKFGFCIIDIKKMQYVYVSSNTGEIAGWSHEEYMKGGIAFAFSVVLPGFQAGLVHFSQLTNEYFRKLPDNEKPMYRAYYDFQISSPAGIKTLLQQDYALRYNDEGDITLLLATGVDVKNQKSDRSMHLRITNGKENRLYEFEIASGALHQLESLSPRELEIAKLVSQSNDSMHIAKQLNISEYTVKTHRRNMLEKLNVKDSLEMINLLGALGLL